MTNTGAAAPLKDELPSPTWETTRFPGVNGDAQAAEQSSDPRRNDMDLDTTRAADMRPSFFDRATYPRSGAPRCCSPEIPIRETATRILPLRGRQSNAIFVDLRFLEDFLVGETAP